jgi:sn-glycerol 3-phosphate transport system ATP-binding protein
MAAISFRNIIKRYGKGKHELQVIHGVSAEVADGEFIVIVGPSGCGKSTLLRMVAGLEEISGGEIAIGSRVVNDLEPADRDIAMVFQNYALYPHMSVFDNMAYGLKIRRLPLAEIKARVDKAAAILELGHLLQRKPRQLSGGQRQRVAMGRAIVRQPQVFLFDEPLSNLDAKLRAQTRIEIQKLHRELGITSLFVTHDQVEAMTLAQRMMVMNAGVMEQFGTPEEVYHRPASTFVASFIGSPPMNLLKHAPGGRAGAILGVRPEHLELEAQGWELRVETVELLGAERLVYGRLADEQVIVRMDEGQPAPVADSLVHVRPQPDRLHWFDAGTGKRLAA